MKYPTRNQRFYDSRSKDINRVSSLYNLSPEARETFERQHPKEWYETAPMYAKRLERIFSSISSPRQLQDTIIYNPDPASPFFQTGNIKRSLGRTYVSLDIETDDYGHPISISALKFQYDKKKQQFISVDNYQRFYKTHSWDVRNTQAVHGFTPAILKSLRKQQVAGYGSVYKGQEIDDLQAFLGTSVVIGHNIQQFDLDRLFPDRIIKNSTIDTLAAARNAWKGSRNDLDSVFKRIYGKSMEQAGLSHHDANADTVASMMILEAMHKDPGRVGEAIRYVMGSRGQRQLVEYDEYLKSMIVKGTYKSTYVGKGGKRRLNEVYMTAEEAGLKKNGKMIEGFSEIDMSTMDPNRMSDAELLKSAGVDLVNYYKEHAAESEVGSEALQAMNTYTRYQQMNLVNRVAAAKSQDIADAILESAGYGAKAIGSQSIMEMANKLKSAREKEELQHMKDAAELGNWRSFVRDLNEEDTYTFSRDEALKKVRYLNRAERSGFIGKDDRAKLDALVGSYDDLVDATDEVIEANQKLLKVYEAFAKIKPYDVNQYIQAAKGQWSGIMGASRGVIPSFIRNPISRLGDATFNVIDRSVSPWNALNRTWNSGIGNALTGALTAGMGPMGLGIGMAATGVVNASTQIFGNYQQSKLEMAGLNIQNNLNTLGAMISWISTPFQLLHKALKLAIGSLGGFSLKLNSIMGGGIGLMSQMGNPLTEMTGVDYLKYQGTTLTDLASLQSKGSTNAAIESFATMQRNLYRFGQVDTNKLLAANMLGVFNEAFSPSTDTEGAYYSMGNKILHNMMGQSASQQADTLYYVNQLNSNLAQTIRSALMMGVTDLRQLTDPSAFHRMYWRPISDTEEGQFRKTQYEYGVATQQFGYSKMRFADRLWNAVGRDIYNGLNRLVDKAAVGDWKGVLESAGEMWNTLKEKVKGVWEAIQGKGGLSFDLSKPLQKIKEWGWNAAIAIMDAWNAIFRLVLDKSQDLIAYLSTIKVDLVRRKDGGWGIDISTIKDVVSPEGNSHIYERTGNSQYGTGKQRVKGGYEGYAALADILFPNASQWEKDAMTIDKLKEATLNWDETMGGVPLELAKYNLYNLHPKSMEDVDKIFDTIARYDSGRGVNSAAAARAISGIGKEHWRNVPRDESGLLTAYDSMVEDVMDAMLTARSISLGDKEEKITVEFKGLGDQPITATRENGKWKLTGMNPLQSVKLYNGAARASVQVQ